MISRDDVNWTEEQEKDAEDKIKQNSTSLVPDHLRGKGIYRYKIPFSNLSSITCTHVYGKIC